MRSGRTLCLTAAMAVRHATTEDLSDLLPLFRAYCDFYEASPTDEGLNAMMRGAENLRRA